MKKLRVNSFWDYTFDWRGRYSSLIYLNAPFFTPKTIIYILLVIFAFASLVSIKFLTLFLSLLSLVIYFIILAKKTRVSFQIKRNHDPKSKEEKELSVGYQIENRLACAHYNLLLFDFNNASAKSEYTQFFESSISPNSRLKKNISLPLNNGMGNKSFGPLVCIFSDCFGFNEYQYTQPRQSEIQVFPHVYPTISPTLREDRQSLNFGNYDNYKKGSNVNFYSTKEYQQGDNVKFINWKLSLKSDKLIVNEFEASANANLYAVIIDDDRLHFGEGSDSSFEYCKDLMLSLLYSNVNSNNEMGFISHQKQIKARPGTNHLRAMELFISTFETKIFEKHSIYSSKTQSNRPMQEMSRKVKFYASEESNLFVFTGLVPGRVWEKYLQQIIDLRRFAKHIHLIVISGFGKMIEQAGDSEMAWLSKLNATSENELSELKKICRNKGITCSIVKVDSKFKYSHKMKRGFTDARS